MAKDIDHEYEQFLQTHQLQLALSNIPKHFYRRLYEKIKHEVFDSGSYFQMCPVDDDDEELEETFNSERRFYVSTLDNVVLDPDTDENAIFLIDHAWTYKMRDARNDLKSIPKLYERMASLMNVNSDTKEDGIDLILQRMWKFNQTYTLPSKQNDTNQDLSIPQEPYWYVMDEFGSSIRHAKSSQYENVRCTTFYFEPTQTMFTILYPIVRIEQPYTEIFRNYVDGSNNNKFERNVKLLPWHRLHFRKAILRNLTLDKCPEIFSRNIENDIDIFEIGHKNDLYDKIPVNMPVTKFDDSHIWKVYTDDDLVKQYLTDQHYQLIDDIKQADIVFTKKTIKDFRYETLHSTLVNQYPFESVITNKELLALVARRWKSIYGCTTTIESDPYAVLHGSPPWLPTTYNLVHELPQIAVYYQYREDQQLDNSWIIKPVNLANSIDVSVTNSLDMILRLPESGPKIASKYVSTPVLLQVPEIGGSGIKFDIRYVLLLRSVRPLKLYVHKIFWLRFANKPFSLDELDDFEVHFTLANGHVNSHFEHIDCETFKSMFNEQQSEKWSTIEQKIFDIFREIFHCATIEEPPLGIGSCVSSRAVYTADLILDRSETIQPKLLEINFLPNLSRACRFYPNFYNQIFNVLFRDLNDEDNIVNIL